MGANPVLKYDRNYQGGAIVFGTGSFYGRTGVTSAANGLSVNITAAEVNSDSIITLTIQSNLVTSEATPPAFFVTSINPGVGFSIGTIASMAVTGSYTAMWEIKHPAGVR